MKRNGYLEKRQNTIEAWRVAERQTWIQFMADTLMITLNSSEIMGKDTFGQKRIKAVIEGWGKVQEQYLEALGDGPETDYQRAKLDERLRQFLDEETFDAFSERYSYLKEIRYDRKAR